MQTSQTPFLVHSGCFAYRILLLWYPSSLRSRFQQEMLAVFEDQLRGAWQLSGYRGVLESWWRALLELLCLALPARLDALRIPAVSILLSLLLTALFFANVIPQGPCPK
ncbi:MAG TPA: hypothetical protein VED65_00450 [Candidatus Bathyarchaeia archaeon]|nr:hypothetical protein [Candidatus Bathyarchaeia archaeon]